MSESFEQAIRLTRVSASEHDFAVPDGWQVGRGAFGGLVLGATLAAIVADEPEASRVPRAFLGEVCAPLMPGAARLQTRSLRRGNSQSNIACDLTQGGQVVAHGSAVLATSRKIGEGLPRPPYAVPQAGRFEDAAVLPFGPPDGPPFFNHYEPRPTSALPFSGRGEGVVTGWIRCWWLPAWSTATVQKVYRWPARPVNRRLWRVLRARRTDGPPPVRIHTLK